MKNLKKLSDDVLLENTRSLVDEERRITTSILWHLHEVERRKLDLARGYSSLFAYAVQGLGYSDGAAGRRIAAMRLLVEVPDLEPALEKGETSVSTLCTLQHFFKKKETPTSPEEKKELALSLRGKSKRETEKVLVSLAPETAPPKERERAVSATETEIRFVADDSLLEKLEKIRALDAHVNSNYSYLDLFHRLADPALKKLDPTLKKDTTPPKKPQSLNERSLPAHLKRAVWRRDQGSCAYVSPEGRRCGSRFAVQVDHITPIALGGKTVLENLRLLCRSHNQQQAILKLGAQTMRPYLKI